MTDPVGTSKDSGEHERPISIEAFQRRADRAQRGIEASAMRASQRQLAACEIERTLYDAWRLDLWAGCRSRPAPATGHSTSKEADTDGISA